MQKPNNTARFGTNVTRLPNQSQSSVLTIPLLPPGCEHARFIRSVVSSWRLAEVFLLCEELEAGAALRDLVTQAELAREPAGALHADLAQAYKDR